MKQKTKVKTRAVKTRYPILKLIDLARDLPTQPTEVTQEVRTKSNFRIRTRLQEAPRSQISSLLRVKPPNKAETYQRVKSKADIKTHLSLEIW